MTPETLIKLCTTRKVVKNYIDKFFPGAYNRGVARLHYIC